MKWHLNMGQDQRVALAATSRLFFDVPLTTLCSVPSSCDASLQCYFYPTFKRQLFQWPFLPSLCSLPEQNHSHTVASCKSIQGDTDMWKGSSDVYCFYRDCSGSCKRERWVHYIAPLVSNLESHEKALILGQTHCWTKTSRLYNIPQHYRRKSVISHVHFHIKFMSYSFNMVLTHGNDQLVSKLLLIIDCCLYVFMKNNNISYI